MALILVATGRHEMGTFTKLELDLLEFSWTIYLLSSGVFELSTLQFVWQIISFTKLPKTVCY
jgi:hypothetical protein